MLFTLAMMNEQWKIWIRNEYIFEKQKTNALLGLAKGWKYNTNLEVWIKLKTSGVHIYFELYHLLWFPFFFLLLRFFIWFILYISFGFLPGRDAKIWIFHFSFLLLGAHIQYHVYYRIEYYEIMGFALNWFLHREKTEFQR